jgi:putative intracellular protease/amidase
MIVESGPIVCGVDFSEASRHALEFASAFAARLGQSLVVVSAIDPLIAEAASASLGPAFVERVRNDLEGFVHESIGDRGGVSLLTPAGPAAKELLHAAAATRAGAIAIGTEGLGRARRVIFGSTTLRVMRGADRPVLAVPPSHEEAGAISQILCGVDFSDPSRAAAREAVELGRHLSVPVTLLHAVGRLTMPSAWDVMMAPTDAEREARAKTNIQTLAASLGAPEPRTVAAIAEPGELMAQEAGPVKSGEGPTTIADYSFDTLPRVDILLIPGGMGTRKSVDDAPLIDLIKGASVASDMTTTVCTGTALLARTGLLDHRPATTNKIAWEWVKSQGPDVDWKRIARWVDDGNIVTSSGVSAGIDMALALVARLHDRETAERAARGMEYVWNDDPDNDPFA